MQESTGDPRSWMSGSSPRRIVGAAASQLAAWPQALRDHRRHRLPLTLRTERIGRHGVSPRRRGGRTRTFADFLAGHERIGRHDRFTAEARRTQRFPLLVSRLERFRPERRVDFDGRPNDVRGQFSHALSSPRALRLCGDYPGSIAAKSRLCSLTRVSGGSANSSGLGERAFADFPAGPSGSVVMIGSPQRRGGRRGCPYS